MPHDLGHTEAAISCSPYDSNKKLGPAGGPYQLVRVRFAQGIAVRMLPNHSDDEAVDLDEYDFSKLSHQIQRGQQIEDWLRDFQNEWLHSGICPNPKMYEVKDSFWLREVAGESKEVGHYLLCGHDAHVEVVAKDWEWASEGSLR